MDPYPKKNSVPPVEMLRIRNSGIKRPVIIGELVDRVEITRIQGAGNHQNGVDLSSSRLGLDLSAGKNGLDFSSGRLLLRLWSLGVVTTIFLFVES